MEIRKRVAAFAAATAAVGSLGLVAPTTALVPAALTAPVAEAAPANCGTALDANGRGAWGSCNGGWGSFRVFVTCSYGTNASGWVSIQPGGYARTYVGCGWKGWPRSARLELRDW